MKLKKMKFGKKFFAALVLAVFVTQIVTPAMAKTITDHVEVGSGVTKPAAELGTKDDTYTVTGSDQGGAIKNSGTITGTILPSFVNNEATNSTKAYGGAIYNAESASIETITANFTGNEATSTGDSSTYGGAIANLGEIKSITDSTFTSNTATSGGAIYNYSQGAINFNGTTNFTGNTATQFGGGAIYNSGGTINFNGKTSFRGNKDQNGNNDIYNSNSGTLNFESGSVTTFDGGISGNSSSPGVINFNDGAIITMNDLDWDGSQRAFNTHFAISDQTFNANGGTFVINTDLANNAGDKITLKNCTIGGDNKKVYLQVAHDPTVMSGSTVTGNYIFLMQNKANQEITVVAKDYRYEKRGLAVTLTPTVAYVKNGDGTQDWKITSIVGKGGVSDTTKSVSDSAMAIGAAWVNSINNLQKRMGDLRGGEESNMAWVRFQRSNDDINTTRPANISGNLYQIGYDFALKNDTTSRGYFGLSLDRFDGTQSFAIGNGDIKSTTVSAYYTKIYNSGHYFDFIFRYGRYESDTTSLDKSLTNPLLTKLDYAMNGVTLSGEYGYRANLGKGGIYLEPQAEFIYGYMSGAKKTSSTGTLADIDSTNHFVTRLGLALGQRVKNFNYYLRGSYYHNFAGSTRIKYGDASYKQDGAQNWWEVSLGGGWNLSKISYFYAELTKHFKDVSNSLNFNLGFRISL